MIDIFKRADQLSWSPSQSSTKSLPVSLPLFTSLSFLHRPVTLPFLWLRVNISIPVATGLALLSLRPASWENSCCLEYLLQPDLSVQPMEVHSRSSQQRLICKHLLIINGLPKPRASTEKALFFIHLHHYLFSILGQKYQTMTLSIARKQNINHTKEKRQSEHYQPQLKSLTAGVFLKLLPEKFSCLLQNHSLFSFIGTESHIAQTSLELPLQLKMNLNIWSFYALGYLITLGLWSAGDWTQGFLNTRPVLYQPSHAPAPQAILHSLHHLYKRLRQQTKACIQEK